jgi:acetyltransferase-like isoleucine patch superfamily enzyme
LTLYNIFQRILHKLAAVIPGGDSLRPALHRLRGVNMGENVWISQYVYIDELHPDAVTIGNNCSIGLRVSIITHMYWGPKRDTGHIGPVVIEDDVYIGPHSVILPNVHIGRGSVIKAGTTVTGNVPPGVLWGAPDAAPLAKAMVPLTPEHDYKAFVMGLRPVHGRSRKRGPDPETVR